MLGSILGVAAGRGLCPGLAPRGGGGNPSGWKREGKQRMTYGVAVVVCNGFSNVFSLPDTSTACVSPWKRPYSIGSLPAPDRW